jgi:uncharacterized repeat protein (TIGR01451 family)
LSFRIAAVAILALAASRVDASPRITISIDQAKEVVETTAAGRKVSLVPARSVSPGDVIQYVLTYKNDGDQPAFGAVLEDPIPKGTTFLANSATGENADITFSNDGGKNFAPPVKLTYEIRLPNGAVERRVATPAEYTHIRWTVKDVPAGATGRVSFRVRVN